jgi:DNA-directed RNA polymerase specialized sigma24 family protein
MPDVSDDWLVARLRSNPEQGWRAFVDRYSATVLALIRRGGLTDPDEVMEVYVLTCERLAERRCERLRNHDPTRGGFAAWLPAVVRNVAVDWIRSRAGRRRLFESIRGLSTGDQLIFQLHYWEDMSPTEIAAKLSTTRRDATLSDVFEALERIERALTARQRAELAAWTTRSRAPVPLESGDGSEPIPVAASDPDPEEQLATASLNQRLADALRRLPRDDAAIVRLKFVQGLSNRDIEGALRTRGVTSTRIADILARLRLVLGASPAASAGAR